MTKPISFIGMTLLATMFFLLPQIVLASNETAFIMALKTELLEEDSRQVHLDLKHLKAEILTLANNLDEQQIKQVQNVFKDLVISWKSVQAVYVAGSINSDLLDHPAYIDHFHQGNESIPQLLDKVLNNNKALNKALFKHSTKSITALDYLLFPSQDDIAPWQENGSRRIYMAIFIVEQMQIYTDEILAFYETDEQLLKMPQRSLAAIINALVASSYKLKTWRVGEPGGLIAKTRNRPSPLHLEYYYSGLSLAAINAILQTHKQVFETGNQTKYFRENPNIDPQSIAFMQQRIEQALKDTLAIKDAPENSLESPQVQTLFDSLSKLYDAYYFMLVDALNIQGQIVDADGD